MNNTTSAACGSFGCTYNDGPVYSLNPARAETPAPPKKTAAPQPITKAHKRGEVIIKFKDDTPQQVRDQIVLTYAKNEKKLRGRGKVSKLTIKDGLDLANTIFDLKQFNSIVEFAEPNYLVTRSGDFGAARPRRSKRLQTTPNDPQFAAQWALSNTGQGGGVPGSDIGAIAGWQQMTGSRDTIVAVIDTGVDTGHPDLADNLWSNKREAKGKKHEDDDRDGYVDDVNGWNFVNDNDNVGDDHGHGTAMAGIIAAEGNNRQGIAGVMWQASVMPLKALDSTGSGAISDVVEAMDYAVAHGAAVINCSFGTDAFSQSLLDAINRASMSGALVVASAGNNGWDLAQTPYYPASYTASNLITVAATTNGDLLATFSNYGGATQVAAPGIDVLTTYPGGRYVSLSGTSAAAPLVAGVAGLLKTIRGWVSAQWVRQAIIDGARKVPALDGKVASGGVVSAGEAIVVFMKEDNGGGNGGGGGNNPPGMDLDFMRANRPKLAEPHVTINMPSYPYDDPEPGAGGLGGYFTQEALSKNSVGLAGRKAGEDADPTGGDSPTGQSSINLGSQNVNFVAPVVSLGGRGGLGVNLALSYNSNIYVKNGSSIAFNTDKGVVGVGWSVGFGGIQGTPSGSSINPFFDSTSGKNAFLYIEPDGTRRVLAQVGSTSVYTSYDSSYIEFNNTNKVLRLMNGTQIHFITPTYAGAVVGKRLLPDWITDRNGNFITIVNSEIANSNGIANNSHDWGIDYIIDTLGRTIDFYYESNLLTRVRQNRGGSWFDYVKIYYAPITISTNFSGLSTDPSNLNGTQVWQPWFIEYPTGHNHRLFYTSYGQMYTVEKWVPTVAGQGDGRPVAFTRYDMQSVGGYSSPAGPIAVPGSNTAQTDCPKFSLRQEWAENWSPSSPTSGWMALVSGSETYYVAQYGYEFNIAGNYTKVVDPIDRVFRTDVTTDGLIHTSKTYTNQAAYAGGGGTPLKTTTITYEKDSGLSYTSNLRVINAQINDGGATRRAGYTYSIINGVALPVDVIEYNSDASTIYRHTVNLYNTNPVYSNLHILGLPSEVKVFQGPGESNRVSWRVFTFDESAYFDTTNYTVTSHDGTNYGPGFITGRANLTTVTEYETPGAGWRALSHTKYDETGMVAAVYDGANNVTQFFYTDNFAVNPGVGQTHAFVTKAQSPPYSINGGAAGSSWSGAQYDYYTGNITQRYHIAGTSGTGAQENIVNYGYYSTGRLYSITQPTGGQVTRDYWDNWMAVATYTRIDAANTRYDFTAYDGAGQTRWNGGDHPDGVAGKYAIQTFAYDSVGRTTSASNLTAADGGLSTNYPAWDEDHTYGWLYTTTAYDALNRLTQVTRPDGNYLAYSYTGCGCAGASTVTTTDERGRKRKVVYDFLGRLAEAHNLTMAGATYSKAVYGYNARDLLTTVAHYNSGGAHQDRTFAYDGYGRLQSQTTPEAGTVSYLYWANDLVQRATDARSLYAQFTYNGAGMLTDVDYSDSTPDVRYNYGEYGERTLMQEKNSGGAEIARTNYSYDSFKRLQTETRVFNGLAGTFSVGYQYNYVDAPTRLIHTVNGWTKNVNYAYRYSGALSSVGTNLIGTDPNATTNVASGLDYRAFSALQSVTYGNTRKLTAGYNQYRSQMTSLQVKKTDGTNTIINNSYDYTLGTSNNERVQKITDGVDPNYTTTFEYDEHNRLDKAYGAALYRDYDHDAWGNLTYHYGTGQGESGSYGLSYATNGTGAPLNNRINNAGYVFDAAGNLTSDGGNNYTYDAANRLKTASGVNNDYDGDGNRVKHSNWDGTIYYLWSSVLGEPVAEVTSGGVFRAYVYGPGGGQMMAMQGYDSQFYWLHTDHLGSGRKITNTSGDVVYRGEFDPHGQSLYEWHTSGQTYLNSHKFTGYEREYATGLDNAKARMYTRFRARFMQPDPLGLGAADLSDPQSLNRYSYVQNDPVNATDPSGMLISFCGAEYSFSECGGSSGFWSGAFGGHVAEYNREYGGVPASVVPALREHNERVGNALAGNGYRTIGEILGANNFDIYYLLYSDGSYSTYFSLTVHINPYSDLDLGTLAGVREMFVRGIKDHDDRLMPMIGGVGGAVAKGTATVSRWGRPGLQSGDWVMKGGATWWNYLKSGKWQPGFGNQYAPFKSGASYEVPASSLRWPTGWGIDGRVKGLFGQRLYIP